MAQIFGRIWGATTQSTATTTAAQREIDRAALAKSFAPQISPADAKRYGLENFGNTCYANSVLQALYFCSPFRELVISAPDRSFLYPNPPLLPPVNPVPSSAPTQSPITYPKASTKDAKGKRPISGGVPAANSDDANAATTNTSDAPSTSTANTGPPIPVTPPTLFSALRSLYRHISLNTQDKGTVSPSAFIAKLKKENELFRSTTMHQDAHEFLNYLLNKIVEDIENEEHDLRERATTSASSSSLPQPGSSTVDLTKSSSSQTATSGTTGHATFVHALFEGTLTSETRCLTCETVSSRDESFLDLSIDIEQHSSVTACLRQFSASEMLCQRNKFFCDSCCGLQEAEKRMKVKRLPNVLALHLKRFKYQEELAKYIKLSYRVAFPLEMRLFNTVEDIPDPDRLYELFAIVVHIGGGPHHGHYITIIKAQGTWLVFDDNSVETIKESEIAKYFGDSNNGAGYVLFYQAVDLDRASLGLPPIAPTNVIHVQESSGAKSIPDQNIVIVKPNNESGPPSPSMVDTSEGEAVLVLPPRLSAPPSPSLKAELPSPRLLPADATVPASTTGGFFKALKHSASLRGERSSTSASSSAPIQAPPIPPLPRVNGDHLTNGSSSASGWFSLRGKEKRRDSIPHSNGPGAVSSPRLSTTAYPEPPSPTTGKRPSTAGIIGQSRPLPVPPTEPVPPIILPPPRHPISSTDDSESPSGSSTFTPIAAVNGFVEKEHEQIPHSQSPLPYTPSMTTTGGDSTRQGSPAIKGITNGSSLTTLSLPPAIVPASPSGSPRTSKQSTKDSTKTKKAREAAEKQQAEEERLRVEEERKRAERASAELQKAGKAAKRASRKMSFSALPSVRAAFGWSSSSKEKEREREREREQYNSAPALIRSPRSPPTSSSSPEKSSPVTMEEALRRAMRHEHHIAPNINS